MPIRHSRCLVILTALIAASACNYTSVPTAVPAGVRSDRAASVIPATRAFSRPYALTKYPIPTASSSPNRIVAGPDGALWFTEESAGKIGRITTSGQFKEFALSASAQPSHVASAMGNVWFTERVGSQIGFVTPTGQITYYQTPEQTTSRGIIKGPGKNRVWFTEFDAGRVAEVNTSTGGIADFPVPTASSGPYDMASFGAKSTALWFTEYNASKIAKLTVGGAFTEYATPNQAQGLVIGPDKALWFTETSASKIARMTTSGTITEYPTPTASSGPAVITTGPDGALWFTENYASQIGRITVGGTISEIATPDANAYPAGITTGPDHNIWFVENVANTIVKLKP